MIALTDRQRQVLDAIRTLTRERGYPPSVRELADAIGIRSTNGMHDHLKALRKKGMVTWVRLRSRSLQVVGEQPEHVAAPTMPHTGARIIDVRLVQTRDDRWAVHVDGGRAALVSGAPGWRQALALLAALPDARTPVVVVERGPEGADGLGPRLGTILGNLRRDLVDPSPTHLPFEPPDAP